MNKEIIIEADKLTKYFGQFAAVNEISFTVKRGEIFGFLGANGAGKTTAIKMLTGLLRPSAGRANVAGFDVFKQSENIKSRIGYMSQRFSLYEDLTVLENINFYAGIYGLSSQDIREKSSKLIDKLGLGNVKNNFISALPLGWKQKLAFSVAILHNPSIVFLDEPTGGVDPVTRRQFWELIYAAANNGITVFVTTHYMDEAEYCDRISIMVDGKIAALDTPMEMKAIYGSSSMHQVFVNIARTK